MISTSELVARANQLLDNRARHDEAQTLLEQALAADGNNIEALYYLAWKLNEDDETRPADAARRARVLALCDQLVRVTESRSPAPNSVEARARAFGLSWPLPARAVNASLSLARALVQQADEAVRLHDHPRTQAARRAAAMGLSWATAREQNKPAEAFKALLDWVDAHPLHSAWQPDLDEYGRPNKAASCQGLEPFFAAPEYVEWVRAQPRATAHHPRALLAEALMFAAGEDVNVASRRHVYALEHGRPGRLLSLVALGASLQDLGPGDPPLDVLYVAARSTDLDLVRLLVGAGAPINGDGKHVPLVRAALDGSEKAVRVLLEAGADPETRGEVFRGKRLTALEVARHMTFANVIKALSRETDKPSASTALTGPLREAFKKHQNSLVKFSAWDGELDSLPKFFDTLEALGRTSWNEVGDEVEQLSPSELLVFARLLKMVAAPSDKPTVLTKKDAGCVRIVPGDAAVRGDVSLSTGAQWVIAGSLHVKGKFRNDETTRVAIAGDLYADVVATEGDLYVGGDATVSTSFSARYEAGALVIVGTLRTPEFTAEDHVVDIGKRVIGKR